MRTFATKEEAETYLRSLGMKRYRHERAWYFPGTYHLSHGEYERPAYKARKYGNGWGIRVDYYYCRGTLNAPQSGRLDDYKAECLEYQAA